MFSKFRESDGVWIWVLLGNFSVVIVSLLQLTLPSLGDSIFNAGPLYMMFLMYQIIIQKNKFTPRTNKFLSANGVRVTWAQIPNGIGTTVGLYILFGFGRLLEPLSPSVWILCLIAIVSVVWCLYAGTYASYLGLLCGLIPMLVNDNNLLFFQTTLVIIMACVVILSYIEKELFH